jgi:hypothetical protein
MDNDILINQARRLYATLAVEQGTRQSDRLDRLVMLAYCRYQRRLNRCVLCYQTRVAWVKNAVLRTANEASKLGRVAAQSDMAKDAAAGAAVGAVIAIPIPIIGPISGAVVGATFGVYKNITKSKTINLESANFRPNQKVINTTDVYDQIVKFDDLRKQGIITDDEFEQKKKALLAIN